MLLNNFSMVHVLYLLHTCSPADEIVDTLSSVFHCIQGSASVARGLSKYLDSLLNETMERTFLEIMPVSASSLAPYFDMFAFGISVILAGIC